MFSDGELRWTTALHDKTQRHTLSFQISPRVFGTFRYAILKDFSLGIETHYDRSFDIGVLLTEEDDVRPAIAAGLRDFGGTGIYSSEYIVASKHFFDDRLMVSGGLGWGRLGSSGGFTNPLSFLGDDFKNNARERSDVTEAGRLQTGNWFRGDAALFGGLAWQVSDRLMFAAEYSSDAYEEESATMGFERRSPINLALSYGLKSGGSVTGYALNGDAIGIAVSLPTMPQSPRIAGGIEEAPPALAPVETAAARSWASQETRPEAERRLAAALKDQGITLDGFTVIGDRATVRISNTRFPAQAQALGRTARVLANQLPRSVTYFDIESMSAGMTVSRTTIRRHDLEELEYDLDGSWRSFARAQISDAPRSFAADVDGVYPRFDWALTPYLEPSLFDPDSPVRADVGLEFRASTELWRGVILSGAVRQPIWGNLDTSSRESDSVLPHVRSDAAEYAKQSDTQLRHLTAEYFFRPGKNLFGRVTAGYLETMYGGLSGELLWRPVDSRLALGAEINYARQREFDMLFGFQDYDIVTGHASAYYDFGDGYLGQVDVGRYLAGDYGATFSFDREFDNGFRVGAFFTLTDVSFDDFGEGSFDKGIRVTIPIDWITGDPVLGGFGTTIRPVTRDGGARLEIRNRLYEVTRGMQESELEDRWGRFWR
jgi:hypothetical protein